MSTVAQRTGLPRFQPSRAGIIHLWDYLDEEFVFADGRLVLRGHNGSGKTKALEVLFPFILDGQTDSRRIDPFSGEGRSMKDNLLIAGQDSALGYVWMEFLRATPDGPLTITLIIGMRVHRDWPRPKLSFYITDLRLGTDFGLVTADGKPMPATTLIAMIGKEAQLDDGRAYRAEVASRLFNLPIDRYHQLLDLLLALRRPMLAQGLNPRQVASTLSSGLSPVDETLIEQAARDFANLHAVQAEHDQLVAAEAATTEFLSEYRGYLLTVAGFHTDQLQQSLTRTATQVTSLNAAQRRAQAEAREEDAADQLLRDRTVSLSTARTRAETLQGQRAITDHQGLAREREKLTRERQQIASEQIRLERQHRTIEGLAEEATKTAAHLNRNRKQEAAQLAELQRVAHDAGFDTDDQGAVDSDAEVTAARIVIREQEIGTVQELLDKQQETAEKMATARKARETADQDLHEAADSWQRAQQTTAASREAVLEQLATWFQQWAQGQPAPVTDHDLASMSDQVRQLQHVAGDELRNHFRRQTTARLADTQTLLARLTTDRRHIEGERAGRLSEHDRIIRMLDDAPPSDPHRPGERTGRTGAALWQLTRFAPDVAPQTAAGIEGALLAAGILTGWVSPDAGTLSNASGRVQSDGFLRPLPASARPSGPTLADVLVPENTEIVPAALIESILSSIALTELLPNEDTHLYVTAQGEFQHGVLFGHLAQEVAGFIGEDNRARRRATRANAINSIIEGLDRELQGIAAEELALREFATQVEDACTQLPDVSAIVENVVAETRAAALHSDASKRLTKAARALDESVAGHGASQRLLRHQSTLRRLPATQPQLDQVAAAVRNFRDLAASLTQLRDTNAQLLERCREQDGRVERLRADHSEEAETLTDRKGDHAEQNAIVSAQEELIGEDYDQAQEKLRDAQRSVEELGKQQKTLQNKKGRHHDERIKAENDVLHHQEQLTQAIVVLLEQCHQYSAVAASSIKATLDIAHPVSWPERWPDAANLQAGVTRTIQAADWTGTGQGAVLDELPESCASHLLVFRAATESAEKDLEAVQVATDRIWQCYRVLEDALKAGEDGHQAQIIPQTPVVVEVISDDGRHSIIAFADQIRESAAAQAVLLDERERTVLEDQLLATVAQEIHTKVLAARELVHAMDTDTMARPMSSGITVGISWIQAKDLSVDQQEVTRILKQDARILGPIGLDSLRSRIRSMVRAHRVRHHRDSYEQTLRAVLDYRTWYTFELRIKRPGGKLEPLTAKAHADLSGGEKSAAIHLPLFAAANAIFSSADPVCPRLIALDEAFVGIDARFVPQLFSLTVLFDLDIFITGHDLWIKYPDVPMAAHYDLLHDEVSRTVSTFLMVWDGQQVIDSRAGFGGNAELTAELLGTNLTRTIPTARDERTLLDETSSDEAFA